MSSMERKALILRRIPVFDDPSTSRKLGYAEDQETYTFLRKAEDLEGSTWFEILFYGTPAWIVAVSGLTYAELILDGDPVDPRRDPPAAPGSGLVSWDRFVDLFDAYRRATYWLGTKDKPSQMPAPPLGVEIQNQYIGTDRINCTNFSVSLVSRAMGAHLSARQYGRWQVYADSRGSGYGPGVMVELGLATKVEDPASTPPRDGVYLVQHFSSWPQGHSYLVIDYDEVTDRYLSCEATSVLRVDGFGWRGIGNYRDVENPGPWRDRIMDHWGVRWFDVRARYREVDMALLHVDHGSVLSWLDTAGRIV